MADDRSGESLLFSFQQHVLCHLSILLQDAVDCNVGNGLCTSSQIEVAGCRVTAAALHSLSCWPLTAPANRCPAAYLASLAQCLAERSVAKIPMLDALLLGVCPARKLLLWWIGPGHSGVPVYVQDSTSHMAATRTAAKRSS